MTNEKEIFTDSFICVSVFHNLGHSIANARKRGVWGFPWSSTDEKRCTSLFFRKRTAINKKLLRSFEEVGRSPELKTCFY